MALSPGLYLLLSGVIKAICLCDGSSNTLLQAAREPFGQVRAPAYLGLAGNLKTHCPAIEAVNYQMTRPRLVHHQAARVYDFLKLTNLRSKLLDLKTKDSSNIQRSCRRDHTAMIGGQGKHMELLREAALRSMPAGSPHVLAGIEWSSFKTTLAKEVYAAWGALTPKQAQQLLHVATATYKHQQKTVPELHNATAAHKRTGQAAPLREESDAGPITAGMLQKGTCSSSQAACHNCNNISSQQHRPMHEAGPAAAAAHKEAATWALSGGKSRSDSTEIELTGMNSHGHSATLMPGSGSVATTTDNGTSQRWESEVATYSELASPAAFLVLDVELAGSKDADSVCITIQPNGLDGDGLRYDGKAAPLVLGGAGTPPERPDPAGGQGGLDAPPAWSRADIIALVGLVFTVLAFVVGTIVGLLAWLMPRN